MFHIDSVCKKRLRRKEEYATLKYGGGTYYFCCKTCKEEFEKSPLRYIPEGTHKGEELVQHSHQ